MKRVAIGASVAILALTSLTPLALAAPPRFIIAAGGRLPTFGLRLTLVEKKGGLPTVRRTPPTILSEAAIPGLSAALLVAVAQLAPYPLQPRNFAANRYKARRVHLRPMRVGRARSRPRKSISIASIFQVDRCDAMANGEAVGIGRRLFLLPFLPMWRRPDPWPNQKSETFWRL